MPRIAAVSGRTITWFSRVNPRPFTTFLCFTGVQIIDRTHFNWIFPLAIDFAVFVVIYSSSTDLPRNSATCSRLLSFFSASKVALITLCGLVVPIDFVNTF